MQHVSQHPVPTLAQRQQLAEFLATRTPAQNAEPASSREPLTTAGRFHDAILAGAACAVLGVYVALGMGWLA